MEMGDIAVRHGIARIDDQFHDHLLELPAIGANHPQRRVVVR